MLGRADRSLTKHADYRHCAEVPAEDVAQALAERVRAIDYRNFKNSVGEYGRHEAYMKVWKLMWRWGRHNCWQGGIQEGLRS